MVMTCKFSRGETLTVALEATSGDIAGATCRIVLKRGRQPPGDAAAEAAVMTVTAVDHVDSDDLDSAPGWIGVLSDTQTGGLVAGNYVMDARIELGGAVIQTDWVLLTVLERVTEAADG